MRYVRKAGGPNVTALVMLVQQLSRDLSATVLLKLTISSDSHQLIIIIIIMAGMAVFYVASYLIEERRRWPVITASPRGQSSK